MIFVKARALGTGFVLASGSAQISWQEDAEQSEHSGIKLTKSCSRKRAQHVIFINPAGSSQVKHTGHESKCSR